MLVCAPSMGSLDKGEVKADCPLPSKLGIEGIGSKFGSGAMTQGACGSELTPGNSEDDLKNSGGNGN